MTYSERARETVRAVVDKVEPYVPQIAKNTISYATVTAANAANYGVSTATSAVDYTKATVTGTVNYGVKTAVSAVDLTRATVGAATNLAQGTAASAINYGKIVVTGATTTITSYTPGPILNLVQSTVDGAVALRSDPVATLKPYVPTFVLIAGSKTFEIVVHAQDVTQKNINSTTGYIVTKVNGTVEYVTSVPAIHTLIERLQSLTAPVLKRLQKHDGSVEAEQVAEKEQ